MPAQTRNRTHPGATGRVGEEPPLVAIVGNPNAGKTTLFNALTGARQHVANYPGVTVERVSSVLNLGSVEVECVDVPGLYSLDPVSMDEQVAVSVIRGTEGHRRPALLVYVADAGNLERNLFFFSQLAELGIPMILALTMVDLIEKNGAKVDVERLSKRLGVDVISIVAHKRSGLTALLGSLARNLEDPRIPTIGIPSSGEIETKVNILRDRLARSGVDADLADLRAALLGGEPPAAWREQITGFSDDLEIVRRELTDEESPEPIETGDRYAWAARVQVAVLSTPGSSRTTISDRLDRVLTNRLFGFVIFAAIMGGVFLSIYSFADPIMGWIESGFGWLGDLVKPWLEGQPVLQSLVVDGLITGVGSVLVFLPQIVILFFFVAVLEGTGYLARAAFLMDRLLGWCGLNGRAFIPLLSSFACAVPGIMAARVMPDPKARLATILVAPLMSCSARLPVYLLLIGAFIAPTYGPIWAGLALYGMHLVGLVVAIPVAFALNRGLLKGRRLPFLLELPPYQLPKWKDVLLAMYFRGKSFVQTAGTIIVVMSLVIWALLYFPRSEEADARYRADFAKAHGASGDSSRIERYVDGRRLEDSFLGRFGKTIEPAFVPAGFDWRLTTSILAAFPAREVVVPSLGIIFNLGDEVDQDSDDLREALDKAVRPDGSKLVTPWTAVSLMVFFALCCQCMATLATVRRETGTWKWPAFMFAYMTILAYLAAVGIHQLSKL